MKCHTQNESDLCLKIDVSMLKISYLYYLAIIQIITAQHLANRKWWIIPLLMENHPDLLLLCI